MKRVALVTGSSRGLGAATARSLAQSGFHVGLMARSAPELERLASGIRAAGGSADVLVVDVTDSEAVGAAVARLQAVAGEVEVLVNNAGMVDPVARLPDLHPSDFARTIAVNLHGAFHCAHAVLPGMRRRGSGTIVQVSSGAAHRHLEGWTSYCVGKAGLWMLTQALHGELASLGIAVYGFQPGTVDTEMQAVIRRSGINPVSQMKRSDHLHPSVPAECIAWLVAHRPPALRGQDLRVDRVRSEMAGRG